MFPFDYDRDYLQPPYEKEKENEHDPDFWVYSSGHWIYVGDDDEV